MFRTLKRNSFITYFFAFGIFLFISFSILSKHEDASEVKIVEPEMIKFDPIAGNDNLQMPAKHIGRNRKKSRRRPLPKFKKAKVVKDLIDPPPISPEILELHRKLNLSNPGHMGKKYHINYT